MQDPAINKFKLIQEMPQKITPRPGGNSRTIAGAGRYFDLRPYFAIV